MTEETNNLPVTIDVDEGKATVLVVGKSIPPGTYILQGTYQENDNYQEGSDTGTLIIDKDDTTTTLSGSSSGRVGTAIKLTVNVSNSATGTVTLYDNNTAVLFNQSLTEGSVVINYTPTTSGTHSIYAVYSGDENNHGSTSNTLSVNVAKLITRTSVTATTSVEENGTCTVNVSIKQNRTGNTPVTTGTINIYEDEVFIGNINCTMATNTFTFNPSVAGTHIIRAEYVESDTHEASTNQTSYYYIKQSTPHNVDGVEFFELYIGTTNGKLSSTTIEYNDSVDFGLSIPNNQQLRNQYILGRSYTIYEDGTPIVSNKYITTVEDAGFTYTPTSGGTHTYTAEILENNDFLAYTTNSVTVTVNPPVQRPTTTTISSNLDTVELGESTTISVSVFPEVTGTVTVYEDDTPIFINQSLINSTFSIAYTPSTHGTHSLYATYNGYDNNAPSTSAPINISVVRTPTVTILKPTIMYAGEPVTYQAQILYQGQPADGKCVFKVSGKSVKNSSGTVQYVTLDSNGYATLDMDAPTSATTPNVTCVFTSGNYANVTVTQPITFYTQSQGITPVITWDSDDVIDDADGGNYVISALITRADGYLLGNATVQVLVKQNNTTLWTSNNITTTSTGIVEVLYPNTLVGGEYEIIMNVSGTTLKGSTINAISSTFNLTVNSTIVTPDIMIDSDYEGGGLLNQGGLTIYVGAFTNNQPAKRTFHLFGKDDPENIMNGYLIGYELQTDDNGEYSYYFTSAELLNTVNNPMATIPETIYIQAYTVGSTPSSSNVLTIPVRLVPHPSIIETIHDSESEVYMVILETANQENIVGEVGLEISIVLSDGSETVLDTVESDEYGSIELIIDAETFDNAISEDNEVTLVAYNSLDDVYDELIINVDDITRY